MKKLRRLSLVTLILSLIIIILLVLVIKLFNYAKKQYLNDRTTTISTEVVNHTQEVETTVYEPYNGKLCGLEIVTCKSEKVCSLDEISCLIKAKAEEYGIDWKIAVSISKWETGNYTSKAFKEKNNSFGMMKWNENIKNTELIIFETMEDGIIAGVKNLKKNYFDKGLTTLELIQKLYAPIDAKNDPNKLNNYWLGGTTTIYEQL